MKESIKKLEEVLKTTNNKVLKEDIKKKLEALKANKDILK